MKRQVYLDEAMCAACEGKCCKQFPGGALPDDITRLFEGSLAEVLASAFASGEWVADWWDGDPRLYPLENESVGIAYFIRPRASCDFEGVFNSSALPGVCILLEPDGCRLTLENRPHECRMLEPWPNQKCIPHGKGKRGLAIAWLLYHDLILDAAKGVSNANTEK
jgi:Fe-S-cluster containining protein